MIAIVNLLREEEMSIDSRAAKHNFTDEIEANDWHRSRLKSPSSPTAEQRLLSEGKDPAANTPSVGPQRAKPADRSQS
jgi:hypothetical protein